MQIFRYFLNSINNDDSQTSVTVLMKLQYVLYNTNNIHIHKTCLQAVRILS